MVGLVTISSTDCWRNDLSSKHQAFSESIADLEMRFPVVFSFRVNFRPRASHIIVVPKQHSSSRCPVIFAFDPWP
jgi:hypothetical protein